MIEHDASDRTIYRLEVGGFIRWSRMDHMVCIPVCAPGHDGGVIKMAFGEMKHG